MLVLDLYNENLLLSYDYVYETMSDIKENVRVDSGTEDELAAPSKLYRVKLRKSAAGQASSAGLYATTHANVSKAGLIHGNSH